MVSIMAILFVSAINKYSANYIQQAKSFYMTRQMKNLGTIQYDWYLKIMPNKAPAEFEWMAAIIHMFLLFCMVNLEYYTSALSAPKQLTTTFICLKLKKIVQLYWEFIK